MNWLLFIHWLLCSYTIKASQVVSHSTVVHGKRESSNGWIPVRRADKDSLVHVGIALTQQNVDTAELELHRVSDPSSPDFGQHWSPSRVMKWFSPPIESVSNVVQWLNQSGIPSACITSSSGGSWLRFHASVSELENLLSTSYYTYTRSASDAVHLGCEEYSVPRRLAKHINFITPTVHPEVSDPKKVRKRTIFATPSSSTIDFSSANISQCQNVTTPDCLRGLYHLPNNTTINPHPESTIGMFEESWLSWLPGDLDSFFNYFAPSMIGERPKMVHIDGGYWQNTTQGFIFNAEADLDLGYVMGLTTRTAIVYQTGDSFQPGSLNDALAALDSLYCNALNSSIDGVYPDTAPFPGVWNHTADCGTISPFPAVLMISYAWNEVSYPEAYLKRQCLEFLKLGLQGVTIIVSAADCGAAGQDCSCLENGHFNPTTPSVCPYVTSVGATQLPANGTTATGEVAFLPMGNGTNISSSGGGFSNVFDTPKYQAASVTAYFREQGPSLRNLTPFYNPKGRGIPDIAANGKDYITVIDGDLTTVMGTSASVPTVASLVVLLNDARLRAGKSKVGFLNPVLYAHPEAMNDITSGENYGCGRRAFIAGSGWDPVTGLGTPDLKKLEDIYLKLP